MQGALEGLLFIVGDDGISKDRIKEIMEIDDNKCIITAFVAH